MHHLHPRNLLDVGIRNLYPGYFAMVMATGIVSNGFYLLDHTLLADALLAIAVAAFAVLFLATIIRAIRFPRLLWADMINPRLVFSFFTIVAAADVLGLQFLFRGFEGAATVLWLFALTVWIPLSYFSFSVLTFRDTELNVGVVGGGWLIAIVGAESIAALGANLAPEFSVGGDLALVTAHAFWGFGIVLYGIFVTLFAYRIFFERITAEDMNPLFWVVMGAAAISVNAGSTLLIVEPDLAFLAGMESFIYGSTLILWAWATWWIPLLVIFGIYRHLVMRVPISYHPMYWSLVFPLGMYTLATYQLAVADDFSPFTSIPKGTIWIAFAAWLITMTGLVRSIWRGGQASSDSEAGLGF